MTKAAKIIDVLMAGPSRFDLRPRSPLMHPFLSVIYLGQKVNRTGIQVHRLSPLFDSDD